MLTAKRFYLDRFFHLRAKLLAGNTQVFFGNDAPQHFFRRINDHPGNFTGKNKFSNAGHIGKDQDHFSHMRNWFT